MQSDIEFAQAAIDMLPGSVEEIVTFLRSNGIRNNKRSFADRPATCPIARWVGKWTDNNVRVSFTRVRCPHDGTDITLPEHVRQYIYYADS